MAQIEFIDALSLEEGAREAAELFEATFGSKPAGVWDAPGRVNVIGEHTDYNEGLCLPIALPHRTFIALSPREDTKVRVISTLSGGVVAEADLDGLEPGGVEGWAAYPVGVAWAMRERGGFGESADADGADGANADGADSAEGAEKKVVRGFDAAFSSCVPLGGGLSSSAAMTCSTALALDDVYGLGLGDTDEGRVTLVRMAVASENEMAGAATGGLDQSASLRCQAGKALLLDCNPDLSALDSVSQQDFDLDSLGLELLVLDTQAPHSLNDGQYAARRRVCEESAEALGVRSLRVLADRVNALPVTERAVAVDALIARLESEEAQMRVRHVITEIGRVTEFVEAFKARDVKRAGELMNSSHNSLRDDYEVTVPQLDVAVDVARAGGAYGARMTGGGFGGSIIALVDKGQAAILAQKIADEFESRGWNAPRALAVVASAPAERVR
ncbi:galactokinase [Alloscardovia macacae]|uniref:Galactokinase n=1 Tax=Alloscardovia macacae TaxID=1160091 RepID=A0A261F6Z6_9BIFI|nr:galactokinase [Alloscardovia macacae]OZG54929.1 galactokinase [Alloscardovia macacae]